MTTTKVNSIKEVANSGNLNQLADVAQKVKLGQMLQPQKLTFTGLVAAAAHNLSDAAHGALPAIGDVLTLRVTAGAAAAGDRMVTDAGGTASATVAKLSDDGTTLTFEANVTGFVITYTPRAAVDVASKFA